MRSSLSVVALISARGGGDAPPVSTIAVEAARRGHRVALFCDGPVASAFLPNGIPALNHAAADQAAVFAMPRPPDKDWVVDWAARCFPAAIEVVRSRKPDILICSLHCMHLAERLGQALSIPWVFVNPSFYFGEDGLRSWTDDFPSPYMIAAWRQRFLPVSRRAAQVLHATDPEFDPPPATIPKNHHYVGPLIWEGPHTADLSFLDEPGMPWVLVTLSTLPQADEMEIARAAISALATSPLRVLVTLPPGQPREQLGTLPANTRLAGFIPHRPVLERAVLLISQAGHGLVMKGLYHGVPMVLVPWDRDQPGVAARAQLLGVAETVPRNAASPAAIAEAIGKVLGNSHFAQTAALHARRLQSKDPAKEACDLVLALSPGD